MITQELVKSLFDYDSNTGVFKRKVTVSNNAKAGQIINKTDFEGYLKVAINKKSFKVHRLIWIYLYGEFPKDTIDHINGIRHDNRIENLRECTAAENLQNKKFFKNNTTGYKGVVKKGNKFVAQIGFNGKCKHLGYFFKAEDAHKAYCEAGIKYHTHNEHAKKVKEI
jgi:hypothetical protein